METPSDFSSRLNPETIATRTPKKQGNTMTLFGNRFPLLAGRSLAAATLTLLLVAVASPRTATAATEEGVVVTVAAPIPAPDRSSSSSNAKTGSTLTYGIDMKGLTTGNDVRGVLAVGVDEGGVVEVAAADGGAASSWPGTGAASLSHTFPSIDPVLVVMFGITDAVPGGAAEGTDRPRSRSPLWDRRWRWISA
jgi:hypothetical protein